MARHFLSTHAHGPAHRFGARRCKICSQRLESELGEARAVALHGACWRTDGKNEVGVGSAIVFLGVFVAVAMTAAVFVRARHCGASVRMGAAGCWARVHWRACVSMPSYARMHLYASMRVRGETLPISPL